MYFIDNFYTHILEMSKLLEFQIFDNSFKKIQGIDLIHVYTLFVQITPTHCTQSYFEYHFYRSRWNLGEELRCNLGHFHDRRVGMGACFSLPLKC